MLSKCKIPPFQAKDFVNLRPNEAIDEPAPKAARDDEKFKDDHLAIFRNHDLVWPPSTSSGGPSFQAMCTHLTRRQMEAAFFMKATTELTSVPTFADLNLSLCYLIGTRDTIGKDFFKPRFPNLTAQSIIYMRWQGVEGEDFNKLLSGTEVMQVVGWDKKFYNSAHVLNLDDKLLRSLAGNAFSAFSVGIITLASRIASSVQATTKKAGEQIEVLEESQSFSEDSDDFDQ